MRAKLNAHYHWVIAAMAVLAMLVCGGVGNSLNGITLIPITQSLGVSRGEFSTAMIAKNIGGVVLNMVSGALFVKIGYRKLVPVALLLSGLGFLISSSGQTLTVMCVAGVMEGMYTLCTSTGNPRILGTWFHKHYGLLMGIVTAMTGLGGSIFSIVFARIVAAYNWRAAYLSVAIMYFVLALLLALLMRDRPQQMGLKPYGEGHMPKNAKRDTDDHWEGFSMAQLKKKPVFYLMVLGTLLSSICGYTALSVVSPHIQDCGMSPEFAAGVQSVVMIGLAVTKLMFGALSDKVGAKLMTLVSLVSLVASMLLLANVSNAVSAYIAALVYALALPLCGIVPPLLLPSLFGYGSGVKAIGIMYAILSTASMIANPLTNTLRDRFGSYRPVFQGTAVVAIGVTALYILLYVLAAKERKKLEQQTSNESE